MASRKEIRQAIMILTQKDPDDNFTILEEKGDIYRVEVHWTKDESEVIHLTIHS